MQAAQIAGEQEQEELGSGAAGGTLFGAKAGVKLADGQQVAEVAAKAGGHDKLVNTAIAGPPSPREATHSSRFAQRLEEAQKTVKQQAKERQRYSSVVSRYPPQPDPVVEELSEGEVARWGCGREGPCWGCPAAGKLLRKWRKECCGSSAAAAVGEGSCSWRDIELPVNA
jgi:hypothetical protein